jgi:TonB-linked SusC/RagA family outer membrane protein
MRIFIKHLTTTISVYFFILFLMSSSFTMGQEVQVSSRNEKSRRSSEAQKTLKSILKSFEKEFRLHFAYDDALIDGMMLMVPVSHNSKDLNERLRQLLAPLGLNHKIVDKSLYVIQRTLPSSTTSNLPDIKKDRSIYPELLPDRTITGKISDEKGDPAIGVSLLLKGSTVGTFTDINGNFSIVVPDQGSILIVSYIGYLTQEVIVGERSNLQIEISPDTKILNEIVVVGYGIQKKSDLTGSLSIVTGKEIANLPMSSIDQALQGRSAGVHVTQNTGAPGEGVSVRIRGIGSINDNSPLFIVDGIPTKDAFQVLTPGDIESISILKDAASASIYGARAGNGVILVTTKRGKSGEPQVSFSSFFGIQQHGKLIKMVDTPRYVELYNEAANTDNIQLANPTLNRKLIPAGLEVANTDWQKEIFRTAPIQNYQMTISGGTEKIRYLVSGNYFNQKGIVLNSGFDRYSLRANMDINVTKKLKVSTNINMLYSQRNIVGSSGDGYGGNGGSVVRYALFRTPAIPVFDKNGEYSDLPDSPQFFGDGYNPVALAMKMDNKERHYRVFGNTYLEYTILENLKFKSDGGLNFDVVNQKRFNENWGTNLRINSPSTLSNTIILNSAINWNNTLTYNKVLNEKHDLSVLAGTEAIKNISRPMGATDYNFIDQIDNLRYLGQGLSIQSRGIYENDNRWALFSLFGRATYSFKGKYLASANVRRDGSSRFSTNNRYGTFYSGSVGWNIDREPFMASLAKTISLLKIRASVGQLGNQDIGNYPWASLVGSGYNYPFGSQLTPSPGYAIVSRGNANVKWESSTQTDIGLEVGLWNDKLILVADLFNKRTSDMLIPIPVPKTGGSAAAPYVNAGKVENKGLELELTYKDYAGALYYSVSGNVTFIQNKVLSLSSGRPIPGGRIDNGVFATRTEEGHPIGSFYLYQMEGIFQNEGDIFTHAYQGNAIRPGDVKFKDIDNDGLITEKDRAHVGSAIPKATFGLNTNFEYKNFDLSLFFQGAQGNKIYYQVATDIEGFYRAFNVTERVYNERWTGEGTSNTQPRVSWTGSSNNKLPSTRFLSDGSYVRLKNIQIGYSLKEKAIKKLGIRSARVYISGQNLLTVTKYPGMDPEMATSDNTRNEQFGGDVAAGIDWGTYPSAKIYSFGVNINF